MKWIFRLVLMGLFLLQLLVVVFLALGPGYLSKKLRKRKNFEAKNRFSPSFKAVGLRANIAFEVASEGELEQIRPLLDYYLGQEKRVELIFASESVEIKCNKLAQAYPEQIRIYRLPILTLTKAIRFWMTAPHLVFCRYDFYPELLLLGMSSGRRMSVVSATLKNKRPHSWFYKNLYRSFDKIVAASACDQKIFEKILQQKPDVFDFRVLQIVARLKAFEKKWQQMPLGCCFDVLVEKYSLQKRILMGSCWPLEMELFCDQNFCREIIEGRLFVALAPHRLGEQALMDLRQAFDKAVANALPLYHIGASSTVGEIEELIGQHQSRRGVFMITVPGILCELYMKFGCAYVGGGFGRSIHSVLEPYLAGAKVLCGPRTHRSTEYDLVRGTSPQLISTFDTLRSFYQEFKKIEELSCQNEARTVLIERSQQQFLDIAKSMELEC